MNMNIITFWANDRYQEIWLRNKILDLGPGSATPGRHGDPRMGKGVRGEGGGKEETEGGEGG